MLELYQHVMTSEQKTLALQVRSVRELMDGRGLDRPSNVAALDETFKKAPKAKSGGHEQAGPGI
jgi:hypothetical protein